MFVAAMDYFEKPSVPVFGMQALPQEMKEFPAFFTYLGYRCRDASKNPAYRLFLG